MKKKLLLLFILSFFPIMIFARVNNNTKKKDYANVVFFVYFKGDTKGRDELVNNFHKTSNVGAYFPVISYKDMYDGDYETSFKKYMSTISYGKVEVHNIFPQIKNGVLSPLELSMDGKNADKENIDIQIIKEILNKYSTLKSSETLDYDNNNFIDNFTVFIAGERSDVSGSTLVSHKADFGDSSIKWNNKSVGSYNVLTSSSVNSSRASVIAHEFMHTIGYLDLYTKDSNNYENLTSTDNLAFPVYLWDIMGMTHYSVPNVLTYLKMKISNWNIIDEVSKSTSLTLDSPDDINGNQSYVIKSPFSDYEYFVVEYRKKGNSKVSIDGFINKSGLIVYRVNNTVTGFSNLYGKTGVYVYRERNTTNAVSNVYNAVFDNKDKIGNRNVEVIDNALLFSDGTNSGIELTNIKLENDKITLDVFIPDAKDYNVWADTYYNSSKNMIDGSIVEYNKGMLGVDIDQNKIYTNIYSNNKWNRLSQMDHNLKYIRNSEIIKYNNEIYLVVSSYIDGITLYKFNSNTWNKITSIKTSNGAFSYQIIDDKLYLSSIDENSIIGTLYIYENNSFKKINDFYNGKLNTNDKEINSVKLINLNNTLHIVCNKSNGNIIVFKQDGNSYIRKDTTLSSNTFDASSYKDKIYIVLGSDSTNSNLRFYEYSDGKTKEISIGNIKLGFPKMVFSQGNLYLIAIDNNINSTYYGKSVVYLYDDDLNTLTKEGMDVLTQGANTSVVSLFSVDKYIYVMLQSSVDDSNLVKKKETTNSLVSISIKPPNTLTYFKGDKISVDGLVVTANYVKSSKIVEDYKIENYDTKTEGLKVATITYQGVSNIFSYRVFNKESDNQKELRDYILEGGYKIKDNFVYGFSENESISNIRNKLVNKDISFSSKDGNIKTGIKIEYNNQSYITVLYGDLNKDGKINSADLLFMRLHLLGSKKLDSYSLQAAYLATGKTINSADLLRLRQHLLGTKQISQR